MKIFLLVINLVIHNQIVFFFACSFCFTKRSKKKVFLGFSYVGVGPSVKDQKTLPSWQIAPILYLFFQKKKQERKKKGTFKRTYFF